MPFATTWMNLEIITPSEVSQTEKDKHHVISLTGRIFLKWYKWTYLQNRNTDLREQIWLPGGKEVGDRLEVLDWHVHSIIFKTDNQQGPMIQHRELCSVFCSNLNGKRIWKRIDTCIYITESLCYTPETNATSLINYTSIQTFLKKEKKIQFGWKTQNARDNEGIKSVKHVSKS